MSTKKKVIKKVVEKEFVKAAKKTAPCQPKPSKIPFSNQHSTLVKQAGYMRKVGLAPVEIFAALLETNKRCEKPYAICNLKKIAGFTGDSSPNHERFMPMPTARDHLDTLKYFIEQMYLVLDALVFWIGEDDDATDEDPTVPTRKP